MSNNTLKAAAVAAVLCATLGIAPRADGDASRRDAQTMKQKVAAITAMGARRSKEPHRTMVTENEVNAFLAYEAKGDLPAGVVDPSVSILGTGRLSGRAVVDLDAVRKTGTSTGLLDPRSYLTGHLPVSATGVLRTSNGMGRFELESTSIGGVPIPKLVLQEIVGYYSRTPERPGGISLDDAFALPAGIREIQVERGQAIIVQ
jgi:hypothetical protein